MLFSNRSLVHGMRAVERQNSSMTSLSMRKCLQIQRLNAHVEPCVRPQHCVVESTLAASPRRMSERGQVDIDDDIAYSTGQKATKTHWFMPRYGTAARVYPVGEIFSDAS
jgi:hypothetical protein